MNLQDAKEIHRKREAEVNEIARLIDAIETLQDLSLTYAHGSVSGQLADDFLSKAVAPLWSEYRERLFELVQK